MSAHHDHHHNHHGHGDEDVHDHGHDHDDETPTALQTLVWKQIDFEKIRTLNESQTDAGKNIVKKTWPERLNAEPVLTSDADEQLLMFIPFTGVVKLHSILVRGSDNESCPQNLKIFKNREDIDFSTAADLAPTQTLVIPRTNDVQELPVKRPQFGNTYNLTLFFEDNYGDDASELYWVGFKGEVTHLNREPFEVLYEKAANPKDHEMVAGIGERGALPGGRHGM